MDSKETPSTYSSRQVVSWLELGESVTIFLILVRQMDTNTTPSISSSLSSSYLVSTFSWSCWCCGLLLLAFASSTITYFFAVCGHLVLVRDLLRNVIINPLSILFTKWLTCGENEKCRWKIAICLCKLLKLLLEVNVFSRKFKKPFGLFRLINMILVRLAKRFPRFFFHSSIAATSSDLNSHLFQMFKGYLIGLDTHNPTIHGTFPSRFVLRILFIIIWFLTYNFNILLEPVRPRDIISE